MPNDIGIEAQQHAYLSHQVNACSVLRTNEAPSHSFPMEVYPEITRQLKKKNKTIFLSFPSVYLCNQEKSRYATTKKLLKQMDCQGSSEMIIVI